MQNKFTRSYIKRIYIVTNMSFKTLFNDISTKKELYVSNYVEHIHIMLQTLNNMKRIHIICLFSDIIHYYISGNSYLAM